MTSSLRAPVSSWSALPAGLPQTVSGPSKGFAPDLDSYRVACLHLSPQTLWLFGAIADMPAETECNGERNGLRKFNLAMQFSVRQLVYLHGAPVLDPEHDDSMHGFQLALPVSVQITRTPEPIHQGSEHHVLSVVGTSAHLNIRILAEFVDAYGGKHAKKRFMEAMQVRD